jgi:hypothetical protein
MAKKSKHHIVRPDGTTTCCNAYTSVGDDFVEYCKGCFEEVIHASEANKMLWKLEVPSEKETK